MYSFSRKTVASMVAFAVIMSVASCSKTERSGSDLLSVVSEDTEWFGLKTSQVCMVDSAEFEYSDAKYIGEYNGKYIFQNSAVRRAPEGFDYDRDDMSTLCCDTLETYDTDGNLISSLDIGEQIKSQDVDLAVVGDVLLLGDSLIAYITNYDQMTGATEQMQAVIDLESGTVGELVKIEAAEVKEIEREGAICERSEKIGDYLICNYCLRDESTYAFVFTDENGNNIVIDLRESIPELMIFNITNVVDMGNGKYLACGYTSDGNVFICLDPNSGTASIPSEDLSWINADPYNIYSVDGVGGVVADSTGIYKIDFAAQSMEELFRYDNSNINRYIINGLVPVTVTDDRIVMIGTTHGFDETLEYNSKTLIVEFTKADSNPNVGKSIIYLAALNDYNYELCESVCRFNETNSDFFITFDNRYMLEDPSTRGVAKAREDSTSKDARKAELGNQLAVDLMSGNGPDIIIDGFMFDQINKDDYLVSLNSYVDSNLTDDKYFNNIITAGNPDEQIYQIPITFCISGLSVNTSDVSADKPGLTYDEYKEFVSGTCNGTDPMELSRVDFFIESFNCMSDLMTDENGNPDFNCDAFKALAEYTRDNVIDPIKTDPRSLFQEDKIARLVNIPSAKGYIDFACDGKTVIGLPTYDARGPMVSVTSSIAISALSPNTDGCMMFLNDILSNETQLSYTITGYGIPVNREAFNEVSEAYVDYHNRSIQQLLEEMDEGSLRSMGYNTTTVDESVVGDFTSLVNNISGARCDGDSSINNILREEMPSFFEGQKTIDEVIMILTDRAQTIVNERR